MVPKSSLLAHVEYYERNDMICALESVERDQVEIDGFQEGGVGEIGIFEPLRL